MLDATNSNENFVWQILLFTLCGGKARSVFINCFAFFSEHSINYNAFDVFEVSLICYCSCFSVLMIYQLGQKRSVSTCVLRWFVFCVQLDRF